jgi:hypothetical protein
MDQNLFDIAAFQIKNVWIMEHYRLGTPMTFEEALAIWVRPNRASYREDSLFEEQWKDISSRLDRVATRIAPLAPKRAHILKVCAHIARQRNPDGSKIKKPLGFFGGAWFAPSHPDPTFRTDICEKNLLRYWALGTMHEMF